MGLDYANERFVVVYTRDTVTWKLLDWEARAVLLLMLRKVDRAGVIEVGEDGLAGLAAILEVPLDVLERAMPKLTKDERGTVTFRDGYVALPNFIAAQETPRSDRQRQKDSRETRRDVALAVKRGIAVTETVADVTKRDATVTPCHAASQSVTPNQPNPIQANRSGPEREGGPASPPPLSLVHPERPDPVTDLWAHQERRRAELPGTRPLKLTADRRKAIAARRKDGHTDDDLRACIDAYADEAKRTGNAEWFNGESNWVAANVARTLGRIGAARGRDGPGGRAHEATGHDATAEALRARGFIP